MKIRSIESETTANSLFCGNIREKQIIQVLIPLLDDSFLLRSLEQGILCQKNTTSRSHSWLGCFVSKMNVFLYCWDCCCCFARFVFMFLCDCPSFHSFYSYLVLNKVQVQEVLNYDDRLLSQESIDSALERVALKTRAFLGMIWFLLPEATLQWNSSEQVFFWLLLFGRITLQGKMTQKVKLQSLEPSCLSLLLLYPQSEKLHDLGLTRNDAHIPFFLYSFLLWKPRQTHLFQRNQQQWIDKGWRWCERRMWFPPLFLTARDYDLTKWKGMPTCLLISSRTWKLAKKRKDRKDEGWFCSKEDPQESEPRSLCSPASSPLVLSLKSLVLLHLFKGVWRTWCLRKRKTNEMMKKASQVSRMRAGKKVSGVVPLSITSSDLTSSSHIVIQVSLKEFSLLEKWTRVNEKVHNKWVRYLTGRHERKLKAIKKTHLKEEEWEEHREDDVVNEDSLKKKEDSSSKNIPESNEVSTEANNRHENEHSFLEFLFFRQIDASLIQI